MSAWGLRVPCDNFQQTPIILILNTLYTHDRLTPLQICICICGFCTGKPWVDKRKQPGAGWLAHSTHNKLGNDKIIHYSRGLIINTNTHPHKYVEKSTHCLARLVAHLPAIHHKHSTESARLWPFSPVVRLRCTWPLPGIGDAFSYTMRRPLLGKYIIVLTYGACEHVQSVHTMDREMRVLTYNNGE